jgi:cytoskeletal protein RodZ
MLFVNFVGLVCAVPRLHLFPASHLAGWQGWLLSTPHRMYDGNHMGTIVLNVVWALFNMMLLSVATAVAWENQQRRRAVRVNVEVPAGVILPDGRAVQGLTGDLSSTGVRLWTGERLSVQPGSPVRIVLPVLDGDASLPATVIRVDDESLRAQFDSLSLAEDEALTMVLYSRADTWLGWDEKRDGDHLVRSFAHVFRLALRGLRQTILPGRRRPPDGSLLTSIAPLLLAAILLPVLTGRAVAQDAQERATTTAVTTTVAKTAATVAPAVVPPIVAQPKPEKQIPSKKMEGVAQPTQDHHAAATVATVPRSDPVALPASLAGHTDQSIKADSDALPAAGIVPVVPKQTHAPVRVPAAKAVGAAVSALAASAAANPLTGIHVAIAAPQATPNDSGASAQFAEFYRARVVPVWARATVLTTQYPWGLLIAVVFQTFLIAVLLRAGLRRRARERLLGHI